MSSQEQAAQVPRKSPHSCFASHAAPIAPAVYAEKRALARARQSRPAQCVSSDGGTVLEVAVGNISPLGARIAGAGVAGLPEIFELRIPDGFGGYSARQARLVWSRGAAAGLRFIDDA